LLTPGTRLGPYEIVGVLGAGGMGEVYRATDRHLGRDVAIKMLPQEFEQDAERVARFEREAKSLASLNHRNIAIIYGVERTDSGRAIVMELVEGPTLADRIGQGAIPVDEALAIALQIAEALAAAHEQSIIHRDLKPANIKLRPDGAVKVLDFGLAKTMPSAGGMSPGQSFSPTITTPAMTQVGLILGTAAYMSPEQAKGRAADTRSDVWAFGCVLYEMLTARRAFDGEDVSDSIAAILRGEPAWTALPASTPPAIKRLLRRCLIKNPCERLHDIADARLEIQDAESDESSVAHVPSRRDRLAWSVVAALGLVSIILAALMARSAMQPSPSAPVYRMSILPPAVDTSETPSGRSALPRFGRGLALSPDGRHLAFVADRKLKRIDAAGGPASTLHDRAYMFSSGTWNRDDVILFAGDGPILRIRAAGGAASPVTSPESGRAHVAPFFLPDGRRFLYSVSVPGGILGRAIYAGALDSNARTKLRDGGSLPVYADGFLLFVHDDTLMAQRLDVDRMEVTGEAISLADQVQVGAGPGGSGAFAIAPSGVLAYQGGVYERSALVWFDHNGRELGILSEPRGFSYPQLSPDERHVMVSGRDDRSRYRDLWLYDSRGARTRLTDVPSDDFAGVWSPNGDRVVFASQRDSDAGLNLYEKASNGLGADKRVLDRQGSEIPTSWSPDGRFILFQTASPGADVWVLSLQDSKVLPFATTRFSETSAQFAPDGRWVAYSSDETGRMEVYVAPFQRAGARVPISTDGGGSPRWRHDGNELFYVRSDNALVGVGIRATEMSVEVGESRTLFRTTFRGGTALPYAVASDGRFLVNRATDDAAPMPITLVVNWPATLGK
jgi:serine/threonine protein kinase/dipeptidyl aminopeptidase/acylaminoacyl peptidase